MKQLYYLIILITTLGLQACKSNSKDTAALKKELSSLVDKWHLAATEANEEEYFGFIADESIYIGTDPKEKWDKKAFYGFAEKYFKRGKAWDFKTIDRAIYLTDDANYAWFDERLDTWMGICRSSGVLKKYDTGWKIEHYHLSVTIANELIKDFMEVQMKDSLNYPIDEKIKH